MKIPKKINKKVVTLDLLIFTFIYVILIFSLKNLVYTSFIYAYYICALIIYFVLVWGSSENYGKPNFFAIYNYFIYKKRGLNKFKRDRYINKEEIESYIEKYYSNKIKENKRRVSKEL